MNYDEIINYILYGKLDYNVIVTDDVNIERDANFNTNNKKLRESIASAKSKGANISSADQDGEFIHVSVNKPINSHTNINGKSVRFYDNKVRIYIGTQQKNTIPLAIEFINWALHGAKKIKFKYTTNSQRADQIVVYLESFDDLLEKEQMIYELKNRRPDLFDDMQKAKSWVFESKVNGVYIAPNPTLEYRMIGLPTSYTYSYTKALQSVKAVLEYSYGVSEGESLSQYKTMSNFDEFAITVINEMFARYGILMKRNEYTKKYEITTRKPDGVNKHWSQFEYDKKTKKIKETYIGASEVQLTQEYSQEQMNVFLGRLIPENSYIPGKSR